MTRATGPLFVALLSACARGEGSAQPAELETPAGPGVLVEAPPQGEQGPDAGPVWRERYPKLAIDNLCPPPAGVDDAQWRHASAAERWSMAPKAPTCVRGEEIVSCMESAEGLPEGVGVSEETQSYYECLSRGGAREECRNDEAIPAEVAACIAGLLDGSMRNLRSISLIERGRGKLTWRATFYPAETSRYEYQGWTRTVDAQTGELLTNFDRRETEVRAIPGRPLAMPPKVSDDDPERAFWAEVTIGEALSVAAFARHALELEALGAPEELVARARAAAEDELRHFGIARAELQRWGDRPRFDSGSLLPSLDRRADFEAMVVELVEMGCVNESLSAHEACQLAVRAEHPRMRKLWTSIAADEAEHAALAWEVLEWALNVRPELAGLVQKTFARLSAPTAMPGREPLASRGAASKSERETWSALAWHEVVEPMRRRLLV